MNKNQKLSDYTNARKMKDSAEKTVEEFDLFSYLDETDGLTLKEGQSKYHWDGNKVIFTKYNGHLIKEFDEKAYDRFLTLMYEEANKELRSLK